MKSKLSAGPLVDIQPDACRDIDLLIEFFARQPWGKPVDRYRDILRCIEEIAERATLRRVMRVVPENDVELRRRDVRQIVVMYAYYRPNDDYPHGLVSIRGVKHRRKKDVFDGVREPMQPHQYT